MRQASTDMTTPTSGTHLESIASVPEDLMVDVAPKDIMARSGLSNESYLKI